MKVTFKTNHTLPAKLSDLKNGDVFMFSQKHMGISVYQKTGDNTIVRILNDKHNLAIKEEKVTLCLTEPVVKYEIEEIILKLA